MHVKGLPLRQVSSPKAVQQILIAVAAEGCAYGEKDRSRERSLSLGTFVALDVDRAPQAAGLRRLDSPGVAF